MKDHGSKELQRWSAQATDAYRLTVGVAPTIFTRMSHDWGERGAMRKLIMSGNIESGLITCVEYGIEKWSVEWAAIHLFPSEFTDEERRWAQVKLDETKRVVGGRRKKPKVRVADPSSP